MGMRRMAHEIRCPISTVLPRLSGNRGLRCMPTTPTLEATRLLLSRCGVREQRSRIQYWDITGSVTSPRVLKATLREDARGSTHASLSRQAGIDPKLVADQLGHGLGVNLDVYTRRRPRQPARRGGGAGVRTGPSRFGLKVRKSFVSGEAFTTASLPSRQ